MEITCFNCRQTWNVTAAHIAAAKLGFGIGAEDHAFVCPNCDAKNVVTENDFRASIHPGQQIPVTGSAPQGDPDAGDPSRADTERSPAPANPVLGPQPGSVPRHGIVLVRGLQARREHSIWGEVMGGVRKDEEVTILDMWTDGETTWAQLGPERWVPVQQDGETLIQLTDGR